MEDKLEDKKRTLIIMIAMALTIGTLCLATYKMGYDEGMKNTIATVENIGLVGESNNFIGCKGYGNPNITCVGTLRQEGDMEIIEVTYELTRNS